jgi:hypothetical protein
MHSCFLTIPGAPSSQSAVRVRLSGVADSRGSVSDGFVRTVGVPDRGSAGTRSAVGLPSLKHLSCTPGLQESVQRRSWWRSMFGGRGGRSGIQERDARCVGRLAVFRPHLFVHNDTVPIPQKALEGVPTGVEKLYSDSMDARVMAGGKASQVCDMSTEDLL